MFKKAKANVLLKGIAGCIYRKRHYRFAE